MNSKTGSCLKLFVILFNVIFLLLGLLLTVFGALVYSQIVEFSDLTNLSAAPASFLMVLGGLICIISFLGSCGAFMESYCLLMTFSSIVTVIITAECVSLGLLYHYRFQLEDAIVGGMSDAIDTYSKSNDSRNIVDQLQGQMSCCGGNELGDWEKVFDHGIFPNSCCAGGSSHAVTNMSTTESPMTECTSKSNGLYTTSCRAAIEEYVSSNLTSLIVTVSVFLVVQLLSLIASCSMARSTRKDYYRFV